MVQKDVNAMKASVLSALAHPLRLRILETLRRGPCCVCQIIPMVGGEQSNVSHHLAILRKAGIVGCEKRGLEVWYHVANPHVFAIIDLVNRCLCADLQRTQAALRSLQRSHA